MSGRILLADVVETSGRVASTSGRLAKIEILATLLGRLAPGEPVIAVPVLSGRLRQGRIGIGGAAIRAALAAPPAGSPALTILDLDAAIDRLATICGKGSARTKAELLGALMGRATEDERRFLAGLLYGELRQGALEGVMLEAVARATAIPSRDLRRAAMLAGDLAIVAIAALSEGPPGLARFKLTCFQPVQPMLADTAEHTDDAMARIHDAALEHKLDGARIQVHKRGGEVRIYSRQQNDVTAALPEIVAAVLEIPARELILDGEAIALRPDGTPHPFQVTMRRFGRRLDVETQRAELPLSAFFFDILRIGREPAGDKPPPYDGGGEPAGDKPPPYEAGGEPAGDKPPPYEAGGEPVGDGLPPDGSDPEATAGEPARDGEDLIDRPQAERFDVLVATIPASMVVAHVRTSDPGEARRFFDSAIARGHEGIMVKDPCAPYQAGNRGESWLKVKPAKTLDLVVLAVEWGNGRRKGKLSNLHLGACDERGGFVMLGKTFKGLTDEMLAWQTQKLLSIAVRRDEFVVEVAPELVVEIAFNDLQESPRYPGGLALRFARVKRYREDKRPEDADTIATARAIYTRQTGLPAPEPAAAG